MKIALILLVICVGTQAQVQTSSRSLAGPGFLQFPPSQFFLDVILQSEAQKLLTPDLPEDLKARVVETLNGAEVGFNECNTVAGLYWHRIRCTVWQLQDAKNALKVIENEATARAQATTSAAVIV